jgi:predicted porin
MPTYARSRTTSRSSESRSRVPRRSSSRLSSSCLSSFLATAALVAIAATPSAALAQLTLYGRLHLGLDRYAATGASPGTAGDHSARNRIYEQNSRLGVRATEDLGGGLRAIVQIESGAAVDSGSATGQGGQTNVSTGFLASRDSFVGLEGGLGRLTFGRQSIWWLNGRILQVASTYAHAEVPWFTGQGGRISMGIIRNSDTVQYTTPTRAGANLTLSWSPNPTTGGAPFVNAESRQGGLATNARVLGATARWAGGPFALQLDFGDKITASGAVAGRRPRNVGWKLLGGWIYQPGAQIAFIATRIENRASNAIVGVANPGDDLRQHAWGLSWEHTVFANIMLLAQYGQQQKLAGCTIAGGCDATRSRSYMLGVRQVLSPRTSIYATFNATRNEANQTADYVSSSITSAVPISPGADPRIWAVGVVHNF